MHGTDDAMEIDESLMDVGSRFCQIGDMNWSCWWSERTSLNGLVSSELEPIQGSATWLKDRNQKAQAEGMKHPTKSLSSLNGEKPKFMTNKNQLMLKPKAWACSQKIKTRANTIEFKCQVDKNKAPSTRPRVVPTNSNPSKQPTNFVTHHILLVLKMTTIIWCGGNIHMNVEERFSWILIDWFYFIFILKIQAQLHFVWHFGDWGLEVETSIS